MECTSQETEPHDVLLVVLSYLPSLYELLAMSQVCRFLKDAINEEVMLWTKIIVEGPLSSRLTNDILAKITSKAKGKLKALVLRDCLRISDDGLQHVVDKNPLITKLIIPGCTSLTADGVIRAIETLTKNSNHTLKTLHVNGIYNITKQHLSTLQNYLPTSSLVSDQPIDVEVCPRCDEVRLVFDCPRETCKNKNKRDVVGTQLECRACKFCISRCVECGVCVGQEEVEEAACEDALCSGCWLRLPKCSFCNKPYCTRHAHLSCATSNTSGSPVSLCEGCISRVTE